MENSGTSKLFNVKKCVLKADIVTNVVNCSPLPGIVGMLWDVETHIAALGQHFHREFLSPQISAWISPDRTSTGQCVCYFHTIHIRECCVRSGFICPWKNQEGLSKCDLQEHLETLAPMPWAGTNWLNWLEPILEGFFCVRVQVPSSISALFNFLQINPTNCIKLHRTCIETA